MRVGERESVWATDTLSFFSHEVARCVRTLLGSPGEQPAFVAWRHAGQPTMMRSCRETTLGDSASLFPIFRAETGQREFKCRYLCSCALRSVAKGCDDRQEGGWGSRRHGKNTGTPVASCGTEGGVEVRVDKNIQCTGRRCVKVGRVHRGLVTIAWFP